MAQILGLALLAGAAIPVGGAAAALTGRTSGRAARLGRHGVIAFGGGVLIAAVALVLVPHGSAYLASGPAIAAFAAGGVAFFLIDRALARRSGSVAQLLAMLLDFLPEALALGALLAAGGGAGALLALLIALQNLPEGFNAFDELRAAGPFRKTTILALFAALALIGPLMAWLGATYMQTHLPLLGAIMLIAAGGILYLTFQDIAPEAHVAASGVPALGAVAGFLVGLAGHLFIG